MDPMGSEHNITTVNGCRKKGPTSNPGIPTTIKTMGVNITTIVYLRVLIIQIGSTIILMVVEAQRVTFSANDMAPLGSNRKYSRDHLTPITRTLRWEATWPHRPVMENADRVTCGSLFFAEVGG